jgi:hypothetical protein
MKTCHIVAFVSSLFRLAADAQNGGGAVAPSIDRLPRDLEMQPIVDRDAIAATHRQLPMVMHASLSPARAAR